MPQAFDVDDDSMVAPTGKYRGTVKSVSENGDGSIESEDLKDMGYQDAFLPHQDATRFPVGTTVRFRCYLNSKSQLQAMEM